MYCGLKGTDRWAHEEIRVGVNREVKMALYHPTPVDISALTTLK